MIRSKTFGVLTTLNPDGSPHTTGILYAVSSSDDFFNLYFVTSLKYRKVKNLRKTPLASFLIPFPHYWIRFVPAATITLNGKIDFITSEEERLIEIFNKKRIFRSILKQTLNEETGSYTFLRLKPFKRILCYGLGYNIWELRKKHTQAGYSVTIPPVRRSI